MTGKIKQETMVSPAGEGARAATLLFVDDEANILSALRRLFRPQGYKILTAASGEEGLEILGANEVDLIVSDMRMPGMDGAAFLARASEQWPDTIRILLTGYADMDATVAAINKGRIYKYFSKPWNDNDIILSVRRALEQRFLEQERHRLLDLTRRQNAQLQDLNANLENKVRQRTAEIEQIMGMLEVAHETLKENHATTIEVFAHLIEVREGMLGGHSRRVAEMAQRLARQIGMCDEDAQQVYFAGLLHDIGKIGMPDSLIGKPPQALSGADKAQLVKHPVIGEAMLLSLEYLKDAARMIRCHHEYYDGRGYPDGLSGEEIPLGARILGLVNDLDDLQYGVLGIECHNLMQACEFISSHAGTRYDPSLVEALLALMGYEPTEAVAQKKSLPAQPEETAQDRCLRAKDLQPGMTLVQDLVMKNKVLLLSKGHVLDKDVIQRIQDLERVTGEQLVFHVA